MDNSNIKTINQPRDLDINLYPHQLASVYNMEKLENEQRIVKNDTIIETNIGINSDITGYGKSLAMITLILRDKMLWDLDTPYVKQKISIQSGSNIKKYVLTRHEKLQTTLILANPSIVNQWLEEFKYTKLNVCYLKSRSDVDNFDPEEYDVVIIIPSVFNRLMKTFLNVAWKRFIFDEPGHLRVPSMKEIISGFYWFVTATPYSIISQHKNCTSSFMYTILCNNDSHMNYYEFERMFGDIMIKNDDAYVQQSFTMPETFHHYHQCFNPVYIAVKGIAQPKIAELITAGDVLGAIKLLGGKISKKTKIR
jgi:hypothetical protein